MADYIKGLNGGCCDDCTPNNACTAKPVLAGPYPYAATCGISAYFGPWGTNTPTSRTVTGTLPPGITFDGVDTISGTPTTTGTYTVTITATNACGTATTTIVFTVACDTCAEIIFYEGAAGALAVGASLGFSYNVTGKFCCAHDFHFEWQLTIFDPDNCGQLILKANGSTIHDTGCICDVSGSIEVTIPAGTTTITLDVINCGVLPLYWSAGGNCY